MSYVAIKEILTGEVQFVTDYSEENYPTDTYSSLGTLPEGVQPHWVVVQADDSLLVDYTGMDVFLQNKVDKEAGEFRKNFITDVPGQQATYVEKEKEARAYTADPNVTGLLLLPAEATVRGISIADMAAMVISIADDWKALNAKIEAKRIEAKAAVVAATTPEAKNLAATVDWWALTSI